MKKLFAVLLVFLLWGCGKENSSMDRAMLLRQRIQEAPGCSFDAQITADYGDQIQTFRLHCETDAQGNLSFTVLEPESIEGITGSIAEAGGSLTFDQEAVAFELLADGQLSPVSAPWILIKTLRGGYLKACAQEDTNLLLTIDDSYAEDAFQLEITVGDGDVPTAAQIIWQGRRLLTLQVENFQYL